MKDNKFVVGEEEENKTTSHTHKKPTRHHVKRRSSGRVHVAKLAPMARANSAAAHTDSEADLLDDTSSIERPVMRRSQSQRSLHRMSFDRKGFTTLTPRKKAVTKDQEEEVVHKKTSSSNPASLTDRVVAAPIEQTLNATADNLVVPKQPLYTKIVSPVKTEPILKKQLLRSQFITSDSSSSPPSSQYSVRAEENVKRNLSRTQQKVMLQRQQVHDESSRHLQKMNKELSREYKCIRRYQDPMKDSLIRCLESLMLQETKVNRNTLQHSMSSSVIPVIAAAVVNHHQVDTNKKCYVPHLEQRQIAHRHHHLKSIALSRHHPHQVLASSIDSNPHDKHVLGFSWNATTAFLDRMFSTK